jgi:rhodanese-related sulfurtransferase
MTLKRVSPEEARDLLEKEGYVYVDVRSIPEFEGGHPEGAYNVPLQHVRGGGLVPNPDFMAVMEKSFPKEAKLVVGCKSGGRSRQAATLLLSAGYLNVVDQRAGFHGTIDAQGRPEAGWAPKGLPVSREPAPGRAYDALKGGAR